MKNNIILSADATQVIGNLQHSCGTFDYYNDTLTGLFNYILNQSDEIGMSDMEALHTLRVLNALKADLGTLAGKGVDTPESVTSEDVAARVEATFENIDITEKPEKMTKETALEKADTYVKNAKQSLRDALLQLDNALDLVQHRDVNGVPVDDNIISMQVDLTKLRLLLTEEVFDPVFEYIEKGMHSKADSQQC